LEKNIIKIYKLHFLINGKVKKSKFLKNKKKQYTIPNDFYIRLLKEELYENTDSPLKI